MLSMDAIGFGAINYDRLYVVDRILVDGEAPILESSIQPGGSAANTIFGLAKLGMKCGFIGAVGSDHEGKEFIRDFNVADIDTTGIIIKKYDKTGYTVCISSKRNKRSIYICPGANDRIVINDIDYHYVNLSRILHLSSFVNNEQFKLQVKLIENIRKNIIVSFAPGMLYAFKGITYLSPILCRADILFATRKEIETMTKTELYAGVDKCLRSGCKNIVVTMSRGYIKNGNYVICNIFTSKNNYELSIPKKQVLRHTESTGAGDAFAAGFIFGFIKGKDIVDCARIGHLVALSAIKGIGSRTCLPDLASLTKQYLELTGNQLS